MITLIDYVVCDSNNYGVQSATLDNSYSIALTTGRGSLLLPGETDEFPTPTAAAAAELGMTRQTLARWVKTNVFKPGTHFIKRTPGVRAPLWWSVPACQQTLKDYNAERLETYEV